MGCCLKDRMPPSFKIESLAHRLSFYKKGLMGKIFNQKVKKKFEVLNLLTSGIITNKQASEELQLSLRQIYRLKERFILGDKTIESLEYRRIHLF